MRKGVCTALRSDLFGVVWKVSLPVIFLAGTETLDHLINTAFMAHLGVDELGAIAVADSVLLLFLVPPLALVNGIQILTARRAGQRRSHALATAFNQGFAIVLLVSLVLTIALKLVSAEVASRLVESEQIGILLDGFLQIAAYGICPTGATFAYGALLISLGRTWVLVPATLILIVTDLPLNYLFIFGKFGFPELGMRGAAVGLVLAEACVFLFLTGYLWLRVHSSEYPIFRFRRFEQRAVWILGRLSAPIALEQLLETSRWFVFFLILERVSTEALAISNIVYTCYIVFWIPTEGFAETTCSMVGRFVGSNRGDQIGRLLRYATAGAILATIPLIGIALVAPQWIVGIFSPESEVLVGSSTGVRIAALAMLVTIPGGICVSALAGTGDTPAVFLIELVLTVTMLGMAYAAAVLMRWPVALIWLSLPSAWAIGWALSYGWLKSGVWKRITI
jgi:multidrug resistance protein, MATE family